MLKLCCINNKRSLPHLRASDKRAEGSLSLTIVLVAITMENDPCQLILNRLT